MQITTGITVHGQGVPQETYGNNIYTPLNYCHGWQLIVTCKGNYLKEARPT